MKEREYRNHRLAERQRQNSPWPKADGWEPPAMAESGKARPVILDRENGRRVMMRAIVANARDTEFQRFRKLEADLCRLFGGFTRYGTRGGWRDQHGHSVVEDAEVFEVSFPLDPAAEQQALDLFAKFGMDIGEQWVHVERHEFMAHHVKVN